MSVKNSEIMLSFDLDFTLIINTEGILNSFKYAFKKHGVREIDNDTLVNTIGLPLHQTFKELVPEIDPSVLITAFREYYGDKGIYQVNLLPGAREKLEELKNASFTLGVITSKKQAMAIKLLEYLNIDHLFTYILGENDDIKSKLDPQLKEWLYKEYPSHEFVIIGDHPKDMKLSELLDCPFIGILTGNTSANHLKRNDNQKHLILNSVADITLEGIVSLF